jgi:hypothetical protein
LLGGAQQGADVFQQRQTMKQQQAPDLMLALQQMLQRKQALDTEAAQREKALEYQHAEITAQRMRQGGLDYQNALQQGIENRQRERQLGMQAQGLKSLDEYRQAMADKAIADAKAKEEAISAQKRLILSGLMKTYLESPESYDDVSKDTFEKMFSADQFKGVPLEEIASQFGYTIKDFDKNGNPLTFSKMKTPVANTIKSIEAELKKMGDLPQGDAMSQMGAGALFGAPVAPGGGVPAAPAEKNLTADDYSKYLEESLGLWQPQS